MDDTKETNGPAADTTSAGGDNSDRAFDIDPTQAAEAPLSPEEKAAADAVEAAAQANAARWRQKLQSERAAREAAAQPPSAAPEGAEAPEAAAPFAPKRGKERWPVKTVTDPDRGQVNFAAGPTQTTINDLWLQERPANMPLTHAVAAFQSHRAAGPETTVWQIEGRIIAHKWEVDGDFHIVVQDTETGYTMIVESPQDGVGSDGLPFVDDTCPVKNKIVEARQQLTNRLHPKPTFKAESIPVRITGVGFFDILHGQNGVAQTNAIELHPVIEVEFL